MGFPGTWMTETESVVYRVVPKCACSTIGQIMFYSDHGKFFDGDIHDATGGMHKWAMDKSQPLITKNVQTHSSYSFTCVRNPYTRVLSSFFDKICGIQRNGKRYRGNLVPLLIQKYGIEVGGEDGKQEFDQIESFRRFLLFVRDTIRWRKPMDPDIHWSAMSGRPKRAHPVEDYFDDLSMHLIYEIYKRDFKLFKYDFENPANKMPVGEIDLDEVHAKLGD